MGAAWDDSEVPMQHSDTAWDSFPQGTSGKAYVGNLEPLGSHLTTAAKEKNYKGVYVYLFSLHYRETVPKPVQQGMIVIRKNEQFGHPKVT